MNIISCTPGAWLPFQDPDAEEEKLLSQMAERIDATGDRRLNIDPTEFEKNRKNLIRFLRKNNHNLEAAWVQWQAWVQWRHGQTFCLTWNIQKLINLFLCTLQI
jgi:secreted Zn-dependent insulinase-like peptidase